MNTLELQQAVIELCQRQSVSIKLALRQQPLFLN